MRIKYMRMEDAGYRVLELPVSDAELNAQLRTRGSNEAVPKCRFVGMLDKNPLLRQLEGKMLNMDELNFLARRMESLTEYERSVMYAYAQQHRTESLKDFINLTYSLKGLSLITDFTDGIQVGRRLYLDEHMGMSESEEQETDFLQFAEKTFAENRADILPCGVYVEHGFCMQEMYNGRTFPEYWYDEKTVASLEIQNKAGDTEYLYLPADICSFDKMKARLGVMDFGECRVAEVHNSRIPDSIWSRLEDIRGIEDLTFFNELCRDICRFDEQKMKQLSMAVEFVGTKDFTDITYIANNLSDFETHPSIGNDEEYGKFLVKESGLFDVDDLLLPHIDYAGLARDKRQGTLADSGYVSGGFVGTMREIHEYLQYEGEFADPLEMDESRFQTFCLFSPLTGQLYVDGEDAGNLHPSELTSYAEAISDAIEQESCTGEEARGLMHYFDESRAVASKVAKAGPAVREINGELYGVLECKITEPLTEEEMKVLKDYWTGQMSDGWGEGFEQRPISVEDGEIYVSFWSCESFWSVMTAEELNVVQGQDMQMSF